MPIASSTTDPRRHWFLLANGSRAQAYVKRREDSGYDQRRAWDAPEARMRDAELGEDKPGRAFAGAGATHRSGMERDGKDDSPKEHARRDFLEGLAHDLAAALAAKEIDSITLIAPARVAEAITAHLPAAARKAVTGEEHHDLTSLPHAEIFARLDAFRHRI
ncbi:MAG: host attachment protein [Roseomonas sp.]|nr:host attachment protein [Roseomonas sp.]MCA3327480.1 host attachment protein [Roseomonas sp.]MCA3331060.1 host attachment protein [Roseomonas sp.]MCA3334942.1 host attachment protein [Roseomonas sp.]MCA3345951.1 host attachment protein [Roseomonas sp.]